MAATFHVHKSIPRCVAIPALARHFATRQRQHVNPLALKFHVCAELLCSDVWCDIALYFVPLQGYNCILCCSVVTLFCRVFDCNAV